MLGSSGVGKSTIANAVIEHLGTPVRLINAGDRILEEIYGADKYASRNLPGAPGRLQMVQNLRKKAWQRIAREARLGPCIVDSRAAVPFGSMVLPGVPVGAIGKLGLGLVVALTSPPKSIARRIKATAALRPDRDSLDLKKISRIEQMTGPISLQLAVLAGCPFAQVRNVGRLESAVDATASAARSALGW